MAAQPRIVLLHATPVAMEPVQTAFKERWPEARLVNLLDDALSPDRAAEPTLTDRMIERFVTFGRYAYSVGADGILVTCSAFGPAIDRIKNSSITKVIVTNTLPLPSEKQIDKIEVLSIAKVLAETIDAVFEDKSVGEIFGGANQN